MGQDDPEERIAELERQLAEPRAAGEPGANQGSNTKTRGSASPMDRCLTPEQVHNVAFSKPPPGKRGYNEDEVDAFLDLLCEQMKFQQGAFSAPPQAWAPPSPIGPVPAKYAAGSQSRIRRILDAVAILGRKSQ